MGILVGDVIFVGRRIAFYVKVEDFFDCLTVVIECASRQSVLAVGETGALPTFVEFLTGYASVAPDCVDEPDIAVEEFVGHEGGLVRL